MSRRITAFVLAASAALTATQAHADRECFENSCQLPAVVEPPPAASLEGASAEQSQAATHRAAQESLAEPSVRHPIPQPVRHADKSAPRPPGRLAPIYPKSSPMPTEPVSHSARAPVAGRAFSSGALIINVPPPAYGMEGVAPLQPYALYTPAHAPRLYVLAPNAKIISIDDGD
jgi:hypothetical protein